jgi:hypothetical protein
MMERKIDIQVTHPALRNLARREYRDVLREAGCPEDRIELEVDKQFPRGPVVS